MEQPPDSLPAPESEGALQPEDGAAAPKKVGGLRLVIFAGLGLLILFFVVVELLATLKPSTLAIEWAPVQAFDGRINLRLYYLSTHYARRGTRLLGSPRQLAEEALRAYEEARRGQPDTWEWKANVEILRAHLYREGKNSTGPSDAKTIEALWQRYGPFITTLDTGPLLQADWHRVRGETKQAEVAAKEAYRSALPFAWANLARLGAMVLCLLLGLGLLPRWRRLRQVRAQAESSAQQTWGMREAAESVILFLAIQILLQGLGGAIQFLLSGAMAEPYVMAMSVPLSILVAGYAGITWFRHAAETRDPPGWPISFSWRFVTFGLGLAGLLTPLTWLISYSLKALWPNFEPRQVVLPVLLSLRSPVSHLLLFLSICILAPIFEEIFFRGLLYSSLRQRWRPATAALVSGLVFAVMHADLGALLPLVAMAVAFAAIYEATGSLLPCIVAHGLFNFFQLAFIYTVIFF